MHCDAHSHTAIRVRRLAQGHHDTQLEGAGDRTSNLAVTNQPAITPELMPEVHSSRSSCDYYNHILRSFKPRSISCVRPSKEYRPGNNTIQSPYKQKQTSTKHYEWIGYGMRLPVNNNIRLSMLMSSMTHLFWQYLSTFKIAFIQPFYAQEVLQEVLQRSNAASF